MIHNLRRDKNELEEQIEVLKKVSSPSEYNSLIGQITLKNIEIGKLNKKIKEIEKNYKQAKNENIAFEKKNKQLEDLIIRLKNNIVHLEKEINKNKVPKEERKKKNLNNITTRKNKLLRSFSQLNIEKLNKFETSPKKIRENFYHLLNDKENITVVQIAPAVRVALGEEFGYKFGTNLTGKIYAALRRLGFAKVFDTNFGADLTIIEEATEFVNRFKKNDNLPMFTSCCPAWVDYLEKRYPDNIPNLSSCKSPHQMVGAIAKTYWAEKAKVDPAKVKVVSVMPCTAKKWEIGRDETMNSSGYKDVDEVITTRELAKMIKSAGIDFKNLKDEEADNPLGEYSGAATIFGVTGGVMTAALRTAYFYITGKELGQLNFKAIEGLKAVKVAEVDIQGIKVRIAVVNGIGNVAPVMDEINQAKAEGKELPYHFVEVMACPGGCIAGGGQPRVMGAIFDKPWGINDAIRKLRSKGLNTEDSKAENRLSHKNKSIQKLYKDYLGDAGGKKSHHLLHTKYQKRPLYK